MPVFELSKRITWKLKGFYLRPETADRLRAYVNRLQEDGEKIDASDVVDQAIDAFLFEVDGSNETFFQGFCAFLRDSSLGRDLIQAYLQKTIPEKFPEKKKRKQIPSGLRYSILERDGFRCNACGISADDGATLHVDHRIAVANGGTNDPNNLQALCSDCNLGKGAR
jgi:hypothetical protein